MLYVEGGVFNLMCESNFLTEKQEKIMRSFGYELTLKGENMEVWNVYGDDLMIDVYKDNDVIYCNIWITDNNIKTFSPKHINSFLKKYVYKK